MNINRLIELADHLETLPDVLDFFPEENSDGEEILWENMGVPGEGFCMINWVYTEGPHCGSPSCIGGWAVQLFGEKLPMQYVASECIFQEARKVLELDTRVARELFEPDSDIANAFQMHRDSEEYVSSARASKVIRNLVKTGEVDWTIR